MNKEDTDIKAQIKECEPEFIQLIRQRLGIVVKNIQLNDLQKIVLHACQQFDCSPQDYLEALSVCNDDSPYLEYLVTGITIGETYFFRDSHQMKVLRDLVLPALINAKRVQNNLTLRIWSAGCASGEEIYTIAMLLQELLPDHDKWTLQLLGTDINTTSLRKAREGIYNEWSMRSISDYYKKRFFTCEDKKYQIHPEIRDMVNFSYLNLNDDTYPSMFNYTYAQDLILCRNVLIYFDAGYIEALMKKLDACLIEDSFLLLGASDPIYIKSTHLSPYENQASLLIHKLKTTLQPAKFINTIKPIIKSLPAKVVSKVTRKSQTKDAYHDKLNQLMSEAKWEDAIELINKIENKQDQVFLLDSKAKALANLGKLDQAIEACHHSLTLSDTNPYTYFTLAMILAEQNHIKEAESSLRKVLFLDHQFVAGHYQLGLLLIHDKRTAEGIKSLKNALTITVAKDAAENVEGFKDFNYGHLAEILKREIEIYLGDGNEKPN